MLRRIPTILATAALKKSPKISTQHLKSSFLIPQRSFATYKTSTGLVGLDVDPDSRENLIKISNEVLASVKRLPECQYRTDVEKWYSYFVKVSSNFEDVKAIEDEMNFGQLEEIIDKAKDELDLIDTYLETKAWELVEEAKAEAEEVAERMQDVIYFTCPEQNPFKKKTV